MADTAYTDNVTVITADTMNDLNRLHYTIFGDPSTKTAAANALLNTAGNVGIGTASPSEALDVTGNIQAYASVVGGVTIFAENISTNVAAYTQVGVSTNAGNAILQLGSTAGGAQAQLYTDVANGLHLYTTGPAPLLLGTNNAERGRFNSNGYLLLGYTSSNGSYPLQVNGQIFATSGTIATSDRRYKRAITELTGALAIVDALRPVTFRWKDHPVHQFDSGEQIGFIAQEVADALQLTGYAGALVKTGRAKIARGGKNKSGVVVDDGFDEEFLGLAEGKLIPLLVGAVKELAARVAALEAK